MVGHKVRDKKVVEAPTIVPEVVVAKPKKKSIIRRKKKKE